MAASYIDDKPVLVCDSCGEYVSSSRWLSIQEAIKDNGWVTALDGTLYCWDCSHQEPSEVEECD